MKKAIPALLACLMIVCMGGCSNNNEGKSILTGTWVLEGATINGTEYTAKELTDMANQLGEFGQLLDMKLVFNEDGTGEMVYENIDAGDIDMTVTWEGEGTAFSMTDSVGSKTDITYDKDTDTIAFAANQTTMVFKRQG